MCQIAVEKNSYTIQGIKIEPTWLRKVRKSSENMVWICLLCGAVWWLKWGWLGQFTLCLKYSSKLLNAESVSFTNTTLFPASGLEAMGNFCPSTRTAIAGQLSAGRPTLPDCGRAAARQVGRQEQTRAGQVGKSGCGFAGLTLLCLLILDLTWSHCLQLVQSHFSIWNVTYLYDSNFSAEHFINKMYDWSQRNFSFLVWKLNVPNGAEVAADKGGCSGAGVSSALARAARAASSPPSTAFQRPTTRRQLQIADRSRSEGRRPYCILETWCDAIWFLKVQYDAIFSELYASLALLVCQ